ncbi:uncharacterized protein LOC126802153 isoform X3 [Argentina anserina]|uniref:uncharacterized protein LOC126802153 isoform X3 n=1 Tax=Argentina anserina TaxID=57926 RepID=UPI0021761F44|nr:uncharacterized protein LOC126802153 isoform X3 [Potentilla anserina]
MFERLDRACVNVNLLNDCPEISLENLPIIGSDHGSICLTLNGIRRKKAKGFKFEAIWLSHKDFKPLVEKFWNQRVNANPLLNFVTITGQFANQAKAWNKNIFGNLFRKIEDLNERSHDIQQQLILSPMSSYLKEHDLKIRDELLQLYREEEMYWAQKAKVNWLSLGDMNTRFFQTHANIRRKSNYIFKIMDNTGNWATSEQDIADVLVHEFKKQFHLDCVLIILEHCIDDIDNELLLKQITDDEIWEAVNAIGALKAPGPDGLHASFYQNCWTEVKDTVVPMIKARKKQRNSKAWNGILDTRDLILKGMRWIVGNEIQRLVALLSEMQMEDHSLL